MKINNLELVPNAPDGCTLKIGDVVEWKNDYGLEFTNKIIGFNYDGWYQKEYKKFVHLDTDAWWFPHDHNSLTKIAISNEERV